jgi:hypothetical protein
MVDKQRIPQKPEGRLPPGREERPRGSAHPKTVMHPSSPEYSLSWLTGRFILVRRLLAPLA